MGPYPCTNHVQININHTLSKMGIRLYCGSMITILPKSTLPAFPLVIFLPRSPCDQLYRLRDNIRSLVVSYNKVNMAGGHGIVQDRNFKTLLCLKEPLQ